MAQRTYRSSASYAQIETLLEFLRDHRDLARGFMRGPEARERSKRLWQALTQKLNSLGEDGGAIKSCAQWQKVWSDKKHATKKLAAQLHRAAASTGGGPSVGRPLTNMEEMILEIMGNGFGLPQTTVRTPVILNDENVESNSVPEEVHEDMVVYSWNESQEVTSQYIDQDHVYCESPSEHRVAGSSSQVSTMDMPVDPTPGSQILRPTWLSHRRVSDLRSLMLEKEDKMLEELAAIKEILSNLMRTVSSLVKAMEEKRTLYAANSLRARDELPALSPRFQHAWNH